MKFKALLLLGFIIATRCLMAQTDYKPGYIISKTGDTVVGEIDYRGDLLMGKSCYFKANESVGEKEYLPTDISAFRFIDSKYYVSRELAGEHFFLEFLIKGKVNIYYLRNENGDHYYLDKEALPLTEITYDEQVKYEGDKHYLYQSKTHVGILNYYMQDAPDIMAKIAKVKVPDNENLVELAEDYHNEVCQGEKCIIYEKKQPFARVNIQVVGGITSFHKFDYVDDHIYFQAGFIAHFWLPRANEKLFLRTGTLFSMIRHNGEQELIYKIPLQLEYIYPRNKIRPKAAIGIIIYNPFGQTMALMLGANIKMYKKFFLSLDYDIELSPTGNIPVIPKRLIAQSFLVGMYYQF